MTEVWMGWLMVQLLSRLRAVIQQAACLLLTVCVTTHTNSQSWLSISFSFPFYFTNMHACGRLSGLVMVLVADGACGRLSGPVCCCRLLTERWTNQCRSIHSAACYRTAGCAMEIVLISLQQQHLTCWKIICALSLCTTTNSHPMFRHVKASCALSPCTTTNSIQNIRHSFPEAITCILNI